VDLLGAECFGSEQGGGCLADVSALRVCSGKVKVEMGLAFGGQTGYVQVGCRFQRLAGALVLKIRDVRVGSSVDC
jgi:hypothetical protein